MHTQFDLFRIIDQRKNVVRAVWLEVRAVGTIVRQFVAVLCVFLL
jgi:hypothetical protein